MRQVHAARFAVIECAASTLNLQFSMIYDETSKNAKNHSVLSVSHLGLNTNKTRGWARGAGCVHEALAPIGGFKNESSMATIPIELIRENKER
jgi:hypothetical protein